MNQSPRSTLSMSECNCYTTSRSESKQQQRCAGMRKPGSKERIRQFLLAHIGQVVTSIQIRDAAGIGVSEWARRLRELRDEEGWPIRSKKDDAKLRPNEYRLDGQPPAKHDVAFARNISKKLRAEGLARNGF